MSFFVALALLCMFVATVVAQTEVIIGLTAGSNSTLGVFFPDDHVADHDFWKSSKPNLLINVLENSASMYEKIRVGSTLMVETSDFRNRLVIEVTSNTDNEDQERPFNIRFYNIGLNRNDFAPLELEHGTSGYVWVEPGQYVTHNTAVRVPFTLRDSNHVPVITTELFTYEPEL